MSNQLNMIASHATESMAERAWKYRFNVYEYDLYLNKQRENGRRTHTHYFSDGSAVIFDSCWLRPLRIVGSAIDWPEPSA